jgi:tRNA dimethylallyltransferase
MPSSNFLDSASGDRMEDLKPLVAIVGPTGVGKTELALGLAERLDGEIVSADSRLFYRGMDIGTAKPSLEERQRVPHHLIEVANPDQIWSLALFQQRARRAIAEIHARGRLPFLVGGTGQYLRAVAQGWEVPRVEPHPRLRQILENWTGQIGFDGLHARLAVLDPQAAAAIDPHNVRRTVRAIEVILTTGEPFSKQRQHGPSAYHLLTLGLFRPRPELYARIDERIEAMINAGLVDEVRGLLAQGYSPDLPTLSAIGYREIIDYLHGKTSLAEAIALIKRHTRIFVRRQANWFKPDDPEIHWFQAAPEVTEKMTSSVREFLNTLNWSK